MKFKFFPVFIVHISMHVSGRLVLKSVFKVFVVFFWLGKGVKSFNLTLRIMAWYRHGILVSFIKEKKLFCINRNLKMTAHFGYKLPPQCTKTVPYFNVSGHRWTKANLLHFFAFLFPNMRWNRS